MKKIHYLFFFLSLCFPNFLKSQCVLVPLTLHERVNAATLIVEAKVGPKEMYWNQDQTMIYTSTTLHISKVYKGAELLQDKSINLVTVGGTVGMKAIKVDPELETETGGIGIFMLVQKDGDWVAESGPQGYIIIDKHTAEAHDIFNIYPAFSIAGTIQKLTSIEPVDINALLTKIVISSKRAAPTISSISPQVITAGTSSILTIKGTNFETTRDTNSVQFRNADNGGAGFVKALKRDYLSWSDTMIRLIVRTSAGTGKIRVVIGGNGVTTANDTLHVSYAHLNVVSGDTLGSETQQIGMNIGNGITWKMNRRFFDSTGARGAFCRSLERWRCGTFINWDTLGRVIHSAIKPDGVNMCAWDTSTAMPSGVLAQCFSYWGGCFVPGGIKWYVNELDIRFRVKPTGSTNWNYTTGNATGSQFHFESVAVHELGHGHQMGHVINSPVVMHFAIANGQTKPTLSANDISAGNYVIGKSSTSICSKNAHTKLNSGNCAMVVPNANFRMSKTTACLQENITFTDSSQGNISAYAWNFGSGATPATANTIGPHNVKWTTGGPKTITLTITTIQGNLLKTKNANIIADPAVAANYDYVAGGRGLVTFTNNAKNPGSSKWHFGDGDSSAVISPVYAYDTGGTYFVQLTATNLCNTETVIKGVDLAWLNFHAPDNSACINEVVTYADSSDNRVSTWAWTFPGGSPPSATGKGPHKVSYASSGSKSATLAITNTKGGNQTFTRNNIVNISNDTLSKASFGFGYYGNQLVGFGNTSTGSNLSYKWYFGDGDSSSLKEPLHQYVNANNKSVRLVVTGKCNTDDTTIQLRDFTSVKPLSLATDFNIYPNPSDQYVIIQSPFVQNIQVVLTDATGKCILTKAVKTGEKISTEGLDAGLYFVKVYNGDLIQTAKLIVQH